MAQNKWQRRISIVLDIISVILFIWGFVEFFAEAAHITVYLIIAFIQFVRWLFCEEHK